VPISQGGDRGQGQADASVLFIFPSANISRLADHHATFFSLSTPDRTMQLLSLVGLPEHGLEFLHRKGPAFVII